ncbi:hypothetical protein [uncultured Ruegeria sp.]|nr:hypothetical protein [uncultured Ruegeria sp.]
MFYTPRQLDQPILCTEKNGKSKIHRGTDCKKVKVEDLENLIEGKAA